MSGDRRLIEARVAARADRLRFLRTVVRAAAYARGLSTDVVEKVVLAVNEAGTNIIQHAYNGDPAGEIILEVFSDDDRLSFRLTDYAEPVDVSKIKPRPLHELRPGGLGTHFIQEVMDEVVYSARENGSGNQLLMTKLLK